MSKFICTICGYVYDEAKGIPEAGIPAGTAWENIPQDFVCPLCGATKENFKVDGANKTETKIVKPIADGEDLAKLSPLEMSILCSNLARGCEKQYMTEEQVHFMELANYFKSATTTAEYPNISKLLELVNRDLEEFLPYANQTAISNKDRGAMRALVWNEKVTRILNSLLERYNKEGDKMLENTGVYVCTICGFIHIGDKLPEICPVCKVPNFKFEKIEREA